MGRESADLLLRASVKDYTSRESKIWEAVDNSVSVVKKKKKIEK